MNISQFGPQLKAKLAEQGYTPEEIKLGGFAAEFRAALDALDVIEGQDQAVQMARTLLSMTGARIFAHWSHDADVKAPRVVEASLKITEAVEALAAETFGRGQPSPEPKPTIN